MAEDTRRKVAFYLYPESSAADRYLCDELEAISVKDRGRVMRTLLLAGAALRQQDARAPGVLAEMLTDKTTLTDLVSVLRGVIPDAFNGVSVPAPASPPAAEPSNDDKVKQGLKNSLGFE